MLQLATLLILSVCLSAWAQQKDFSGAELLRHALHLADLYNWTDAAPDFEKAEQIFSVAGDQRNALFARLGKIRSTIEQQVLPVASAALAHELETNALLQNDDQLRMFAWIVKGDVDGETNATAMREDWEQVQALARSLGDTKWQYRALAQLGVAAYYEKSDVETARKNVGSALAAATSAGDAGAQIRLLTVLGIGLGQARMYEQALPLFDKALKISSATPDSGYPFMTNEARLDALIGMGQTDLAQHLADDILTNARPNHPDHEAVVLTIIARVLRVPGFYNHKYATPHFVTVENLGDQVYRPSQFPNFPVDGPSPRIEPARSADSPTHTTGNGGSQSERDWAYAMRALARGDEPDAVASAIAAHRPDKPNPQYYGEHTVEKALAALNRPSQIEYSADAGVER